MATALAFVVHDGKFETTQDLSTIGLNEGTRLYLVSSTDEEIVFRRERPTCMGMPVDENLAGWKRMRGVMQDGKDSTEERSNDRAEEAERERRRFAK